MASLTALAMLRCLPSVSFSFSTVAFVRRTRLGYTPSLLAVAMLIIRSLSLEKSTRSPDGTLPCSTSRSATAVLLASISCLSLGTRLARRPSSTCFWLQRPKPATSFPISPWASLLCSSSSMCQRGPTNTASIPSGSFFSTSSAEELAPRTSI